MIDLANISLQFNGKYLYKDINYKINSGDRISLVGANGTGKSSLLKIICGTVAPESGKVLKQKGASIGYLPQENITHKGRTLLEEARSALTDIISLQKKESELTDELCKDDLPEELKTDLVNRLGEVHHRLEELDSYSASSKVEKILQGLGFEESDFERLTEEFSGGWQMRIALSKILISQNDLLMLDEPTNHLDIDSLEWLTSFLKSYAGALLIVSHDKRFVNSVTDKTLEIYLGKFNTFNGDYDAYLRFKEERDKQTLNRYMQQQKKLKETEKFIERFRYKATKAKQVQSRIKQLEKINQLELPDFNEDINIRFPSPPAGGRISIDLIDLYKSYGDKKLFEKINFRLERGEKIAFVGPNGAGKSTLAKIIAGVIEFEKGERVTGHNTLISYYAQDTADDMDPDPDIIETVAAAAEDQSIGQLRSLLGSFLFSGDDVFKKVGVLSGGEKSRVALAKILLTKSNLIVLDEPTNHLDVSSKQVLAKALAEFKGSLIVVSHDIDFLEPIVNKVAEIRKGEIKIFPGGIQYYLGKREAGIIPDEGTDKIKDGEGAALSKKDRKRLEAEKRQQKFEATKDIAGKIEKLENEIELLEKKQKELEELLADPRTYGDLGKAREKNLELTDIKERLETCISEWSKCSDELAEIEKRFS